MEEKQTNTEKAIWVNGNLLNGGKQPRPEVQNILEKLGLKLEYVVPKDEHSSGKDLVQISGPEDIIVGLSALIKAKAV
jgi:hypothetical protein